MNNEILNQNNINLDTDEFKEAIKVAKEEYPKLVNVLKKYMDLKDEYYKLIPLWIIGTYFHKLFLTYPFLFFNAIKGSGKTRLLKIVEKTAFNGYLCSNPSESVIFRNASNKTYLIDETEGIGSKDANGLRLLLNSCYKKGTKVPRMVKNSLTGKMETEEFELYCPVAMANIWGMESVLADRCIFMYLDKTDNLGKSRLLEAYEFDPDFLEIKTNFLDKLQPIQCSLCSVVSLGKGYIAWNNYILWLYSRLTTLTTTHNNNTNYTSKEELIELRKEFLPTLKEDFDIYNYYLDLFEDIVVSGLAGRHLELFFPLFLLAYWCGEDLLKEVIEISKKIVIEKKEEDLFENTDIALLEFIATRTVSNDFEKITSILRDFRRNVIFGGRDEETIARAERDEYHFINPKWLGRALKRLNIIKKKRRKGEGIEIFLDYDKAKSKIKMFKEPENEDQQELKIEPLIPRYSEIERVV